MKHLFLGIVRYALQYAFELLHILFYRSTLPEILQLIACCALFIQYAILPRKVYFEVVIHAGRIAAVR